MKNNVTSACPETAPIYNAQTLQCEGCPQGTFWVVSNKSCVKECASGQVYDEISGVCHGQGNSNTGVCDPLKPIWNSDTMSCELCPQDTPLWVADKAKCMACPAEMPVYNFATSKCEEKICPVGEKWNKMKANCGKLEVECKVNEDYSF